jgi:hypothetical protein
MNVFLAWFDLIRQQDCTATIRSSALLARDLLLLVGRDGATRTPRGPIFCREAIKKESILLLYTW